MSLTRKSLLLAFLAAGLWAGKAHAQTFGIELHNSLMPASGGMAGASLALPQDLQSAINGNPATLTQFHGTNFSFGGAWVEPTYNINQPIALALPPVGPFNAKSNLQGAVLGNIGVTQDFSALGLPATLGIGFLSNAAAGVDFRHVPNSNGTSRQLRFAGYGHGGRRRLDRSAGPGRLAGARHVVF